MGVDLETYRCRIAKGCAIMARISAKHINAVNDGLPFQCVVSKEVLVWLCMVYYYVVTAMLLLIAGIEPNPGPNISQGASNNPYSKEIENGLRLSALLINEGTLAVQKQFDQMLIQKGTNLKTVLNTNKVKMDGFYKGKRKLLNDQQYHLLFPQKGNPVLTSFDLTLLTFLFRNLLCVNPPQSTKNWNDEPLGTDMSLSANLVRIRTFRNTLYGHITSTGIDDATFGKYWNELSCVLRRLNVHPGDIDKWKTECISEHHQEEFQGKITSLMENDAENMQAMMVTTKNVLERYETVLEGHLSEIQDAVTDIKKDTSDFNKDLEFKIASLLTILSAMPGELSQIVLQNSQKESHFVLVKFEESMIQQKLISEKQDKLLKKQDKLLQNDAEMKQTLKDQSVQSQILQKSLSESMIASTTLLEQVEVKGKENLTAAENVLHAVMKTEENMVKNIIELKKLIVRDSTSDIVSSNPSLDHLIQAQKDRDAFKVLIMNKPDTEKIVHKEELSYIIGCGSWDVVIDLNHYSRTTSGLCDGITTMLAKEKDYKVITYKEVSRITDDDKELIAKGMRTLWVLCNGCADTGCESPSKFGKVETKLMPLLEGILTKSLDLKPVVVLNLILGSELDIKKENVTKVCECVGKVCESVDERINYEDSCIFHICTDDNLKDMVKDIKTDLEELVYTLSYNQLIDVLSDCFSIEKQCQKFYFPGERGWCYLKAEAMAKISPYLVLYHRDIGKIDFANKDTVEIEEIFDEVRLNFLKGNVLTPQGLFIQETCQIYVVRKDMKFIYETLENNLKDFMTWSRRNRGYYTICHDASGGGTTTSLYLLYMLREKYPCVFVKKIDENVLVPLKEIYIESRKPVILVLDDQRYEDNDISTFQRRLENDGIRVLVVYVKRATEKSDKMDNLKYYPNCFYIPSKIKYDEDKVAFKKLYSLINKKVESNKVFLFGLYAFCEEYARLDAHVTGCMQNMTDDQKRIILVVYLIEQYGNVATPVKLLSNLIPDDKQKTFNSIFKVLGYGNDLIQCSKSDSSVRPIHRCVLKPLMNFLTAEKSMKDVLKIFIDGLFIMCNKNDSSKEDSIPLWLNLFIKRELGSHFTILLTDIEKHFEEKFNKNAGKQYVVQTLLKFTSMYEGINKEQHPRALYAKYLFYEMKNEKEGIEQITKAVGLQTSQSITGKTTTNNQILLSIYGSIFKAKAYKTFQTFLTQNAIDEGICAAIIDYQEATNAFSLAQRIILKHVRPMTVSSNYAAVQPFLGEAKARSNLLGLCFDHKCKKNNEQFQKFLRETKHEFLRESEKKVLDVLDQLGIAIRLDKVHDNNPSKTSAEILQLKFKILRMRYDRNCTKIKLLTILADDVPCDVGALVRLNAVNLSIVNAANNASLRKCNWEDLSLNDLELIIKMIDRRITTGHMLNVNYSDMIKAMQILRQRSKSKQYKRYNLDYALECGNQWLLKWPDDPSAYFNYGSLKLVKAIETKDYELIKEAVGLLNGCSDLCKTNPSAKSVNTVIYAIGIGEGLEKLVTYKAVQGKGELYPFYGRQSSKNRVCIKLFQNSKPIEGLTAYIPWDKDLREADINQQPNLQFNIALRMKDPFLAFNCERATVLS